MNAEQKPPSLASITFLKGPLAGENVQIVKPITTIGRNKSNDIVVPDQKVSRQHVQLVWDKESWRIEKLSQNSSVTIDQQSIEQAAIQHNSLVGLGEDTSFVFLLSIDDGQDDATQRLSPSLSEKAAVPLSPAPGEIGIVTEPTSPMQQLMPAQTPEAEPLSPASRSNRPEEKGWAPNKTEIASFSALGIPSFEVTDNTSGATKVYSLASKIINIGRDSTNDIVINDSSISDLHLQIVRQDNQWVLIHPHPDRQQTLNGLLYQGRKIRGDKSFRKPLSRGDVFRIEDKHGTMVTLTYNDGSGKPQVMLPLIQPIQLQAATLTIGRIQDNDVTLNIRRFRHTTHVLRRKRERIASLI